MTCLSATLGEARETNLGESLVDVVLGLKKRIGEREGKATRQALPKLHYVRTSQDSLDGPAG